MVKIKGADPNGALEVIDRAMQIQLNINKGNLIEAFLGRLYEEKGHILLLIAAFQQDKTTSEDEIIVTKTHALQCFNSAHAIFTQFPDQAPRFQLINTQIKTLAKDKRIKRKLAVVGRFCTDFLGTEAVSGLEKVAVVDPAAEESDSAKATQPQPNPQSTPEAKTAEEEDDGSMMMVAAGISAIVAVGAYMLISYRKS